LGLTLFDKHPAKELFENYFYFKNMSDQNQLSLWNREPDSSEPE